MSARLSSETFETLQALVLDKTGIRLADSKRSMIATRLTRRLRSLELDCFDSYVELLEDNEHPEQTEFIEAVTTNLTYFFREPHHFDLLREQLVPRFAANAGNPAAVRIWSAGCSSGQEAYTIGMCLIESGLHRLRPVRILCTDIASRMVQQTANGIYSERETRGLDARWRERWVSKLDGNRVQMDASLRALLICKQLNLFDTWRFRPGVDAIFCRNTLIYFSPDKQQALIRRMAQYQQPGGHLFLGHSESIQQCEDLYCRVANTVYERR